jgi:hypothetical protein
MLSLPTVIPRGALLALVPVPVAHPIARDRWR